MASIRERITEALIGDSVQREIGIATARAYEAGFYDGGNDDPVSGDLASQGYRPIAGARLRDFTQMTQEETLNTVWALWQSSPIAKRSLVLKRDHIIGRNTQPIVKDEDLSIIISSFWKNNKLRQRAGEFTLQLYALGEQIYPAFVRQEDGRVKIGYIDSKQVESVIKHPHNAMEDWIVVVNRGGGKFAYYRVIREDEEFLNDEGTITEPKYEGKLVTAEQAELQPWEKEYLKDKGRTEYDGSVFFFGVNRFSNQPRGYSDLVQVADWIDQADATLWAMGEREQFAGYFAFDVTLTGANDEEVNRRARDVANRPPGRGEANFHNENESWEMWSPDLKQNASIASFVAQVTNIMGGMGFPVSWYGYGDDTNRSTLSEQATPSEKTLEHDQGVVKDMFLYMLQFVKDQAEIAGTYRPSEDDDEIALDLPEIRSEDIFGIVQSFLPLLQSVTLGEEAGLNTKETAGRVWHKVLAEIGIELNTEQELADSEAIEQLQIIEEAERHNRQLEQLFSIED